MRSLEKIRLLALIAFTSLNGGNMEKILSLQENWKFYIGNKEEFSHPKYNDNNWKILFK